MPIYNKDGGGSYTPPTTSTSTPAPLPSVPQTTPQIRVYTFNGRQYTSYAAYQSAVSAYQAAQSAARQAALQEQARQRLAYDSAQAARRVAAQQLAAEAARRAAAMARQVAAERARLEQARIAKNYAARLEAERRLRQLELQQRRSTAYQELIARSRAVNLRNQNQRDLRTQAMYESRQALSESRRLNVPVRPSELDARTRRMGETGITRGDLLRGRLLEQARSTGNYVAVLQHISAQQARSGGRYYDQALFEQASKEMALRMSEADKFMPLYEKVRSLSDKGRVEEAWELYQSPEYQRLFQQYLAMYGDDRTPGEYERFVNVANEIADANDRYWERVIVGRAFNSGSLLTDADLDERREAVDLALRHRQARGRQSLIDDPTRRPGATSLRAYVNEIEGQRQRQVMDAYRDAQVQSRAVLRGQVPIDYNPRTGRDQQVENATKFLQLGGLDQRVIDSLFRQMATGEFNERDDARDALIRALERGVDHYIAQLRLTYRQRQGGDLSSNSRIQGELYRLRERMLQELSAAIGFERPGGIPGMFDALSRAPVAGGALRALSVGAGAVQVGVYDMFFAKLQERLNADFGLDIEWLDNRSDERRAAFAELLDATGKPFEGTIEDIVKRLRAIDQFGNVGVTGDALTDFIIGAISDPLLMSPGARLMRGAGLAVGEVGGVRAALGMLSRGGPEARSLASRTSRFFLPERWGGVARSEVTRIETLQKLAREQNIPYQQVAAMSADDLYELARGAIDDLTAEHLAAKSEGLHRLFENKNVNSQQLMAFVQSHLNEFLTASGRRAEDALEIGRLIDEARQIAKHAELAKQELIGNAAREVERTATAQAVDAVRAEQVRKGLAQPVIRPPDVRLSGGAAQKVSRLQAAYEAAVEEFTKTARQTLAAAEHLAKRDITDFNARRTFDAQLRRGIERLRELDDQIINQAGHPQRRTGLVTERQRAVAEYRARFGATVGGPSFPDVDLLRIRGDLSYVRQHLRAARQRLAAAQTPGSIRYWQRRIGRLEAARQGLNLERDFVRGPVRAAQRVARANRSRIVGRFRRSKIAVWAPNGRAARTAVLRDVSARLFGREVQQVRTFTVQAAERMRRIVRDGYRARLVVTADLDDLVREAGRDLTVVEAYTITREMLRTVGGQVWRDAYLAAKKQMANIAAMHGIRNLDDFENFLDFGHATNKLDWLNMRAFRRLDKEIADEINRVTGFKRTGQTRAARASTSETDSPFIMFDDRPNIIAAKMDVLRRHGLSLREYDEIRSVLGDINQRAKSAARMRRQAQTIARETGQDARQVFDELREAAAMRSAEGDLAEFAARHFGLSPEEIVKLWEADHALGDLAPTARKLTEYQRRVLEQIWESSTGGVKFSDEAMRRRLLGGFDEVPEGARRLTPDEVPAGVETHGTPVWVVPDDHPRMASVRTKGGAQAFGAVHDRIAVLIDNEGVWLIESALQQTPEELSKLIHHEMFHAWVRAPQNYPEYFGMAKLLDSLPEPVLGWFFEDFFHYGKLDDFRTNGVLQRDGRFYGEWLADAYSLWKTRAPLTRTADEIQASSKVQGWSEVVELMSVRSPELWVALKELESHFEKFAPPDLTHFGFNDWHPPFGNRSAMRKWLVDNGYWSPHTAEEIQSGQRVWSVADERNFWETNYGFTPDWTKEEIMRPLLDDPKALHEALSGWGFFDDQFERVISGQDIHVVDVQGSIAFGANGLKRGRTLSELRDWVIQRYGDWVTDDGVHLKAIPELMTPAEYSDWIASKAISQAGLKLLGIEMPAGLASPAHLEPLSKAIRSAVERHFDDLSRKLGHDIDVLLPEESYKLALGITDELMATRSWMTFFERGNALQRVLRIAGLQRVLVTLTSAFPVMNLIETFGPKAVLTSLLRNRGRWIYFVDDEFREWIPTLESVAGDSPMTWGLSHAPAHMIVGDKRLPLNMRAIRVPQAIAEAPMVLSEKGENLHRLAFAQNVGGRTTRDLIAQGIDKQTAILLGRLEAHRQLGVFFSILEDASDFEKALNQVVPFFTYNYKNSLIALRLLWEQPWVMNFAQQLGTLLENHAREMWEEQYPGVPFPAGEVAAQHFWFETPWGQTYEVDLRIFSDWTRAVAGLVNTENVSDALGNFLRIPHPLQLGIWATLTGGTTPWGRKGDWRELSPWVDFALWLQGKDYDDPRQQRDLMQIISQMLFFKSFGRIDPIKAKVQQFFAFMALDQDKAWSYYRENPDLQAYFQLNGRRIEIGADLLRQRSWHSYATQDEIDQYNAAFAEYDTLRDTLDAKLDEFYLEPWSPEYREWKKYRYAVIQQFMADHPILGEVWGFRMSREEFAQEFVDWKTDMLIDEFFSMAAPKASAFATDLEYQRASLDYIRRREAFLDAHPDVFDRLYSGRNAVERAWFDHQLHWSEIAESQALLKIRIAREEAALTGNYEADKARRDRISILYELSDQNYKMLDAEAFVQVYDLMDTEVRTFGPVRRVPFIRGLEGFLGRIRETVVLPGRGDYFYQIATPEEKAEIRETEAYFTKLGDLMDELKARDKFDQFWTEMKKRGLLDRYLRENPNRVADYEYSVAIADTFAKGGYKHFWDNLIAQPALLKEYLRRNPDKWATYQRVLVGKRYYNEMQALWNVLGDDFTRFYDELAKRPWLQAEYFRRHPEKEGKGGGSSAYSLAIQDIFAKSSDGKSFFDLLAQNPALQAEYFRRNPDKKAAYEAGRAYFNYIKDWVEAIKRGDSAEADRLWESMPSWVHDRYYAKHPEGAETSQDVSYSAAMGTWVELLQAKEYVRADEYFKALPDWIKERYYAKHPDQRAKHDFSNEMLAQLASYFLAAPGDKAKYLTPELARWLQEHGGNEGAMRGLIFAIYRAIPTKEAWLKRTFKDRYPEYFGREAQGERRLAKVRRELAEHPELVPYYERALRLQTSLYESQLRRQGKPPKPMTIERRRRLQQRRKRRAARLHSRWRHFMALR